MRPAAGVAVIGDALLDVRVTPASPPRRGGDVPALVRMGPGGQGANLAVRLARRGVPVRLACALADDPAGAILADALRAEGVVLAPRPSAVSGTVVILLDGDGERTMLSQRVPLLPADRGALAGVQWVVVSGYALLEPAAEATLALIAGASERRMLAGCAVDPADAPRWAAAARVLRPSLLVLNDAEAALLAPGSDRAARAEALAADLGGIVVVTASDEVAASSPAGLVRLPVVAREAVDATGAGDGFAATLLAELGGGPWPPPAAELERGMAAAAEVAAAVAGAPGAQARVGGERAEPAPA